MQHHLFFFILSSLFTFTRAYTFTSNFSYSILLTIIWVTWFILANKYIEKSLGLVIFSTLSLFEPQSILHRLSFSSSFSTDVVFHSITYQFTFIIFVLFFSFISLITHTQHQHTSEHKITKLLQIAGISYAICSLTPFTHLQLPSTIIVALQLPAFLSFGLTFERFAKHPILSKSIALALFTIGSMGAIYQIIIKSNLII